MATPPKTELSADAYTIGIVYVKPIEFKAISTMLDERHEPVTLDANDDNEYVLGRVGKHNVVLAGPAMGLKGKAAIAHVVARIPRTFKNIRGGLLVGIGGGIPHVTTHDVRLGDVVVGIPDDHPAVLQYDLVKEYQDKVVISQIPLKPAPEPLPKVVTFVQDLYDSGEEDIFAKHLQRFDRRRDSRIFKRPSSPDILFQPDFLHGQDHAVHCSSHPVNRQVRREPREPPDAIRIHYGTILSGDTVMKNADRRDSVGAEFPAALCFEMEAAGVMDAFPCLVIRGVSDYSDSHKNNEWHGYAAATAAAYARQLLLTMAQRLILTGERKDPGDGKRGKSDNDLEQAERLELLQSLHFTEMERRQTHVETAYKETFRWIQDSPAYQQWKSPDAKAGGFLILGKAGSGKSTLMKRLYVMERDDLEQTQAAIPEAQSTRAVCCFFFHGRGSLREKTTEAMLRTLLYQLLSQVPAVYAHVRKFYHDRKQAEMSRKDVPDWSKEVLQRMFQAAFQSPGLRALLFLDALDEAENGTWDHDESQYRKSGDSTFLYSEFLEFIEAQIQLSTRQTSGPSVPEEGPRLRVCLSSRPINFFRHVRDPWTTINLDSLNAADIEAYTRDRLGIVARFHPFGGPLIPKLTTNILQRAEGVFLWVKLVVGRIIGAMEQHRDEGDIWAILCAAPTGLFGLFHDCLRKVRLEDREDMTKILLVVLAAERPISVEELSDLLAVTSSTQQGTASWRRTNEQMISYIHNVCGGLVEVRYLPNNYGVSGVHISWGKNDRLCGTFVDPNDMTTSIQFIHQSAKDFLNQEKWPPYPHTPESLITNEARAHNLVFTITLKYLAQLGSTEADDSWAKCHFLAYAHSFLYHADKWLEFFSEATESTYPLDLAHLLQEASKCFTIWRDYGLFRRRFRNSFPSDKKGSELCTTSVLALAAHLGLYHLFQNLLANFDQIGTDLSTQDLLDSAFVVACSSMEDSVFAPSQEYATRVETMAKLLLDRGANPIGTVLFGLSFRSIPLIWACWEGREELVCAILDTSEVASEAEEMFKLINYPVEICDPDDSPNHEYFTFYTPLMAACRAGNIAIISLLLDRGAKLDYRLVCFPLQEADLDDRTYSWVTRLYFYPDLDSALSVAASHGHLETVRFLVGKSNELEMPFRTADFGYALQLAIHKGFEDVAYDLCAIDRECANWQYVDMASGSYTLYNATSALSIVITNELSHVSSVNRLTQYLIDHGADVNLVLRTARYGSALIAAASSAPMVPTSWQTLEKLSQLVQRLVINGADVNLVASSGVYGSALIAAAAQRGKPGLRLLDWDHRYKYFVMKYLIMKGARVNFQATTGLYGSALAAAAQVVDLKAVKILLRWGAEVNLPLLGQDFRSPLAIVAQGPEKPRIDSLRDEMWLEEQRSVIMLLLEHGADYEEVLRKKQYDPSGPFMETLEDYQRQRVSIRGRLCTETQTAEGSQTG